MTEKTELNKCLTHLREARERLQNLDFDKTTAHVMVDAVEHLAAYTCERIEALESAAETPLPSWASESPDSRLYGARTEPPRVYLGDSVYARFDGYAIVLYLDNGYGPQNEIALEPEVYATLIRFAERVRFTERTGSAHHD